MMATANTTCKIRVIVTRMVGNQQRLHRVAHLAVGQPRSSQQHKHPLLPTARRSSSQRNATQRRSGRGSAPGLHIPVLLAPEGML
jgi:hypothetical protein